MIKLCSSMKNDNFRTTLRNIPFIFLSVLFALWPFIVTGKMMKVESYNEFAFPSGFYYNFFTYYRLVFTVAVTVLFFVVAVYVFITDKNRPQFFKRAALLCIGLIYLIVLSCLLSAYDYSFWGLYDRLNGAFTFIIEILLLLSVAIVYNNRFQLKILFIGFTIGFVILIIFSIFEFVGYDLLINTPLKFLLGVDTSFIKVNAAAHTSFAGMYNKIVLSAFFSMAAGVYTVLFVTSKSERKSIALYILILFALTGLLTTASRGGWVGYLVFIILFSCTKKIINTGKMLIVFLSIIPLFLLTSFFSEGSFVPKLTETFMMTGALILYIFLFLRGASLISKTRGFAFFSLGILLFISIFILTICFVPYKNNPKIMGAGSARGHIYNEVGKVIVNNPFFGTGADSLIYETDHNSDNKYRYLRNEILDKPHSLFLNIAYSYGIPALILFILIISSALSCSFKNTDLLSVVLFWGVVIYVIQGIFFDGVLCSDIFFYTALGLSLGMNKKTGSIENSNPVS